MPFFGGATLGAFPTHMERFQFLQSRKVPFEAKLDAVVFISSNCNPKNDRLVRVQQLQAALANSFLAFHSYGRCLQNMPQHVREQVISHTGHPSKLTATSKYKFCIVSYYMSAPLGTVLLVGLGCSGK